MTFLEMWIGYAIVGTSAFSAVFLWAVRTHQFSDMDRPRRFALDAEALDEPDKNDSRLPSKADRYTWAIMAVVTLAVVVAGVWVGMNNR